MKSIPLSVITNAHLLQFSYVLALLDGESLQTLAIASSKFSSSGVLIPALIILINSCLWGYVWGNWPWFSALKASTYFKIIMTKGTWAWSVWSNVSKSNVEIYSDNCLNGLDSRRSITFSGWVSTTVVNPSKINASLTLNQFHFTSMFGRLDRKQTHQTFALDINQCLISLLTNTCNLHQMVIWHIDGYNHSKRIKKIRLILK